MRLPHLLSDKFEPVIRAEQGIAISPMRGDNCQFAGNLMMPLGKRRVRVVFPDPDAATIHRLWTSGCKYIIWNKRYGLTPILRQHVQIEAEAMRFCLLHIRDGRP